MAEPTNTFSGKDALVNYLNPEKHPDTPLVELPENLNAFRHKKVRIFAKLMSATPLMNVKSLPAYSMLATARADGSLQDKTSIIENSSGNTVLSLSIIGRVMAGLNTSAYVSNEITDGKLKMLRFFGVSPIVNKEPICPDPADRSSGIYKAKRRAEEDRSWLNPGQYDNPANPQAHSLITGEQIWRQSERQLGLFCAGLGTTGTMVGTAETLKRRNPDIRTLGVIRAPNNSVPGPRTRNLLTQIAFGWKEVVDDTVEIGTVESYAASLELCRHGLLVGPSSGFALAGLLDYLKQNLERLPDSIRNSDGELICVFICCDTPFPYFDEYFSVLGESYFPNVENSELLSEKNQPPVSDEDGAKELSPLTTWKQAYDVDADVAWKRLEKSEPVGPKEDWLVIDMRASEQFAHVSLPGSINMPYEEFDLDKLPTDYENRNILLVCSWGLKSRQICANLRNQNLKAYSLGGGLTGWSKENLPRHRPKICNINHPVAN